MIVIRLSRRGTKGRPFYHVVVADKRRARDGKFIELLGYYNPIVKDEGKYISLEIEKMNGWIKKGAQLSERVRDLVKEFAQMKLSEKDEIEHKCETKKEDDIMQKMDTEIKIAVSGSQVEEIKGNVDNERVNKSS